MAVVRADDGWSSTGGWIAGVYLAALTLACSPAGPLAPTAAPPPAPSPAPAPEQVLLRMTGRVVNHDGVPVADALVEVDYASTGGVSTPPSHCPFSNQFCWLATKTSESGAYAVEFYPRPWPGRGLGFIYSFRDGFEVDVQWVPVGPSPAVRDMHLRPTRPILAGESTRVTVGPASSLCTDLEDNWALDRRCEIVVITSGPGTLRVEARPTAGGLVPSMLWYTSGNYTGFITRPAPGTVSIPAAGGTYRVMVAIPEGAASQQFEVLTTLQPAQAVDHRH